MLAQPKLEPNETKIVPTYQIQNLEELYCILNVEKNQQLLVSTVPDYRIIFVNSFNENDQFFYEIYIN